MNKERKSVLSVLDAQREQRERDRRDDSVAKEQKLEVERQSRLKSMMLKKLKAEDVRRSRMPRRTREARR